ncbi:colicin V production protein [Enterobacteriaceae endosymbiont of Plateumaris sericea]|uniref:CvpA family protein n=1 Tax=Enterobacteriaceae endosymbiont of Plateumaris sericea TaxID=2675797 RepID=UPI001448B2BD|nr:CvpA family protein [Enterobacteriaceae endosymbiont of Plateumaris sericea]QJC29821.1 colicin V production protein [Enterobacteriaceae endosymbiont of Plateumaris sericea]
MYWIDYLLIIIIIISTLISWFRGFLKETLSIFTWFFAYYLSKKYYYFLSKKIYGIDSLLLKNSISMFILFIIILIIGYLINYYLNKKIHRSILDKINKILGLFFGIFRGVIIILIFLYLLNYCNYIYYQDILRNHPQLFTYFNNLLNNIKQSI